MTPDIAICYVADRNFLFGTLISIQSLRRFVSPAQAQVFLFHLQPDNHDHAALDRHLADLHCTRLELDINDALSFDLSRWNPTHVPPSALGRFFIEPHLPADVNRILYLDGDTFVAGDLSPLLDLRLKEEQVAGVEDAAYFSRREIGPSASKTRAYLAGLGVDDRGGYLNSGVLLASRKACSDMSRLAMDYFYAQTDKCVYHDQSAINAILGDRRVALSPAWNFQTPFCLWGLRAAVRPRIYHFTWFPKPWSASIPPWDFLAGDVSREAARCAHLGLPSGALADGTAEGYDRRRRSYRGRLRTLFLHRLLLRRRDVLRNARLAVA